MPRPTRTTTVRPQPRAKPDRFAVALRAAAAKAQSGPVRDWLLAMARTRPHTRKESAR